MGDYEDSSDYEDIDDEVQEIIDTAIQKSTSDLDSDILSSHFATTGYDVKYVSIEDISEDDFEWAFALTKTNMESMLSRAQDMGGWSDDSKRAEMSETHTRFIFVFKRSANACERVGFVSFQFSTDEDGDATAAGQEQMLPLIYVYELHVAPDVRHGRIGTRLMHCVADIGKRHNMHSVRLTVLRENESALQFYASSKLGFVRDATSPLAVLPPSRAARYSYDILSLKLHPDASHTSD